MGPSSDQLSLRLAVRGRWQVPLLAVSMALLVAGLFRLRPTAATPSFAEQTAQVQALISARLFPEAAAMAARMLERSGRTEAERAELHRLLGKTSYLSNANTADPDPALAGDTIAYYRLSILRDQPLSAEGHQHVAEAHAWLGQTAEAYGEYQAALEAGGNRLLILRRLYELGQGLRPGDAAVQRSRLEEIARLAVDSASDLLWALQRQIDVLLEEGRTAEATQLVEEHGARFASGTLGDEYEYLRARCRLAAGDLADAARILTALRVRVGREQELAARAGWLLGRAHLGDGRPQEALLSFEEVITLFPGSPWHELSLLGSGEALVALGRFLEAAESYRQALRLPAAAREAAGVDLDAIRVSLTAHYELSSRDGKLEPALRFLELADSLVPRTNEQLKPFYVSSLAELHTRLAAADGHEQAELPAAARDHLLAAAQQWSLYSELMTGQAETSAGALMLAAERLDEAGEPEREVQTLRLLLARWPSSRWVPEALLRLGQRLQASGRFPEAIEAYERNLGHYPRTMPAFQSYIPLAECYLALGEVGHLPAERTLLAVVSPVTGQSVFTPQAMEYRDALYKLGELYSRQARFEEAVVRLEETVQRYPHDPRISEARFMLADAYRRSALALLGELEQAGQAAFRERMLADYAGRTERAGALFGEVAEAIRGQTAPLSEGHEQLFQLSLLYQADCLFDLRRFEEALKLYEEAAWTLHDRSRALSAYVQIVACHGHLGRSPEARSALARAQQLARKLPEDAFAGRWLGAGKKYWEEYLDWIARSGLF